MVSMPAATAPAHAAAVEAHTFHLELTAEGANAPLFLGTASWDQDGFRDILGMDEEEGVYQVTFLGTDWSLSRQVQELIAGGTNIRARVMVTRRINGGFQCSMLADRELRTIDDDDTYRLLTKNQRYWFDPRPNTDLILQTAD